MATDYEGGLPAPMVDELKEPAMTPDELAKVAKGLTVAQREWLLSMEATLDEQPRDYETVFDVAPYVELKPEERCPETGFLLVPADKIWLGSHGCQIRGRAWSRLTPLGQAVAGWIRENENAPD